MLQSYLNDHPPTQINQHHSLNKYALKLFINTFQLTHSYSSLPFTCPTSLWNCNSHTPKKHHFWLMGPNHANTMARCWHGSPHRIPNHKWSNLLCQNGNTRKPQQHYHHHPQPQRLVSLITHTNTRRHTYHSQHPTKCHPIRSKATMATSLQPTRRVIYNNHVHTQLRLPNNSTHICIPIATNLP